MTKKVADIVVLRHAEFLDSVQNKTFAPLTVKGVADAALVGKRIHHNLGITKGKTRILVYVSPVARATQTAALIVPEAESWELREEIGPEVSVERSPASPFARFTEEVKVKLITWDAIVIVTHQHVVRPLTEALAHPGQLASIYEPDVIAHTTGFIVKEGEVYYLHP